MQGRGLYLKVGDIEPGIRLHHPAADTSSMKGIVVNSVNATKMIGCPNVMCRTTHKVPLCCPCYHQQSFEVPLKPVQGFWDSRIGKQTRNPALMDANPDLSLKLSVYLPPPSLSFLTFLVPVRNRAPPLHTHRHTGTRKCTRKEVVVRKDRPEVMRRASTGQGRRTLFLYCTRTRRFR